MVKERDHVEVRADPKERKVRTESPGKEKGREILKNEICIPGNICLLFFLQTLLFSTWLWILNYVTLQ